MPTSKAAPHAKARGAAARSEVNGALKTITLTTPPFDGIKVQGPPEMPATFSWDLAEAHSLLRADNPLALGAFYDLLVSVVGTTGAQKLREALAALDGGPVMPLVIAINDLTAAYGLDEGESSASSQP